jgi:hypothetical protein
MKFPEQDGAGGQALFDEYRRDFTDWDDQTQDDRDMSIIARDYFDGIQWTDQEVDELTKAGQPILTTNLIKRKINFILGTEGENPHSPKAHPRTPMHEEDAEAATDALRAAMLEADFEDTGDEVDSNVLIEGYGGSCFYIDEYEHRAPVFRCDRIHWDRLYYDPRSREYDFRDAQFLGIIVWMHRSEAESEFAHMDLSEEDRDRIMSVIRVSYARDQTSGDATQDAPRRWRDGDDRVQWFETYKKHDGIWHKAIWSWGGWVQEPKPVGGIETYEDSETGEEIEERWGFVDEFGDTWCPLVLESAYVDRNNARYGLVKDMVSPQDEVNKRNSKSLNLLHNRPVLAERGAVLNPDEFQSEITKAGGFGELAPGRLRDNSVQVLDNIQLTQAQLAMGQQAAAAIDQIGPHGALVSADQRTQSGRAFIARLQSGAMEIKPVTKRLRKYRLRIFKGFWNLIRTYWTEEMWVRVLDFEPTKSYRFAQLNRKLAKGQRLQEFMNRGGSPDQAIRHAMGQEGVRLFQMIVSQQQQAQQQFEQQTQMLQQAQQKAAQAGQPLPPEVQQMAMSIQPPPQIEPLQMLLQSPLAEESYTENDIPKLEVDIILDSEPASPVIRDAQFTELNKLLQTTLPTLGDPALIQQLLLLQVRHSDLRAETKREFSKSLAPKPPDPAMQQAQQQQMQLQMAQLQATVEKLQSEVAKNQAQAQKAQIEAQAGVPAAAQLDQAQAAKATVEAQTEAALATSEASLKEAQAFKAQQEGSKAAAIPQTKAFENVEII